MDSGAFSAWNKGVQIDLDEYIKFCMSNLEHISYVVNLDVIPGRPGVKNLSADVREKSAAEGYDNYYRMLEGGVPKEKLIHVFHQGENFKWLEKMVDEIPYIGLSPANDRTTPEKSRWLDECMEFVTDEKGMPIVKFHGFAVTSLKLVWRYPWYSIDSTSWCTTSRNGGIIVPHSRNGKYDYKMDPLKVFVSDENPNKQVEGKHFLTMSTNQQKPVLEYLDLKGYSIKQVETDYKMRDEVNIIYYLDLEKALPKWPRKFEKKVNKGFGL